MGRNTAITARPPGGNTFTVVSAITYLPFGPTRALTYGNSLTETRTYDLDYRLTSIAVNGGGLRLGLTYGYDAANNVKAVTDATNSAMNQATTYDALDRLTGATGGFGAPAYTYDNLGNRLASTVAGAQTVAQYTYDAFGQRLVKTQPG